MQRKSWTNSQICSSFQKYWTESWRKKIEEGAVKYMQQRKGNEKEVEVEEQYKIIKSLNDEIWQAVGLPQWAKYSGVVFK